MKNKTYRFAAALAVLLALCLVFVMPAAAEGTTVNDANEFKSAFSQGGVITLGSDIMVEFQAGYQTEGTNRLLVNPGKPVVLNLNGKTLTLNKPDAEYAISVRDNLTINGVGNVIFNCPLGIQLFTSCGDNTGLTINGGTFTMNVNADTGYGPYMFTGYTGFININGGVFTGPYCIVNSFTNDNYGDGTGTAVTIDGGEFTVTSSDHIPEESNSHISPLMYGEGASVTVNGGTFNVNNEWALGWWVLPALSQTPTTTPTINIVNYITINDENEGVGIVEINAPVKIVGVGDTKPTITCYAEKIFEVYADATFENLELVNEWYSAPYGGRCIDTRTDKITVNINNCVLTTTSVQNNQPLTIGGSEKEGLTVNLSGTTINAGVAGYGVITFVPFTLNIKDNSDVTGYAALYFKSDASPSTVTVENSKLTGQNKHSGPSNNFGTVVFQSGGVTVTLNNADVVHAAATGSAHEWIFDFYGSTGNTVKINSEVTLSVTEGSSYFVRPHGDDASNTQNTVSISAGVTSTVPIDSKYLAEIEDGKLACVATETGYIVQAVSENAVVPETPDLPVEDNKITDTSELVVDTTTVEDAVTIKASHDATVSVVIKGATYDEDLETITIPTEPTYITKYNPINAESGIENGEALVAPQVALEVTVQNPNGALPTIDTAIQDEVADAVNDGESSVKILAMITALGDTTQVNDNLDIDGSENAIKIVFQIPKALGINLDKLGYFHVENGNPGEFTPISSNQIDRESNSTFYLITIHGESFSSYVLAEAQEVKNDNVGSGSAVDTGSGNYQYYPRSVPTDGIVDFGTSKVVTGMELPAGSSGKVTLNIKPTFAMPENGFYAFEIDAPGYNLDAKINGGLSFQIPEADLEAAGWTAKDIVLFHGTVAEDGKITWEALPTNLVKNENGIAYYKAAINGCSPFYIGFVEDGSIVNTEVVDPVTPPTETPDVPGEVLPEIPPVDEPETPESPAPVLGLIAALGAAVVLRRK